MFDRRLPKRSFSAVQRFITETRASLSMELVLVLPLLIWALVASFTFYDAFRQKVLAQGAAYHVADVISRKTTNITPDYIESMNDVLDLLTQGKFTTNLRVSSLLWDSQNEVKIVQWSHGARGVPALPPETLIMLSENDYAALAESMGGNWERDQPQLDLPSRIPPILPGERLILVETFAHATRGLPYLFGLGEIGNQRLAPIAITRPRFTPVLNFDGEMYEYFDDQPADDIPDFVDEPNEDVILYPDDACYEEPATLPGGVVVYENDFTTGDRKDWDDVKSSHFIHGLPLVGSMIGPFGEEAHKSLRDEIRFDFKLDKKDNQFALIEFDLIIIGDWAGYTDGSTYPEGDILTVMKQDKRAVSTQAFQMNPTGPFACTRKTETPTRRGHFTTWMTPVNLNANIMGGPHSDQIWRVTILVERPDDRVRLYFGARLKDGFPTKAYGISDFRVSVLEGKYNGDQFFPTNGDRDRDDPYDGFIYHKHCMDTRYGSKTIGLTNPDLDTPIRYRVEARGHRQFRHCADFTDWNQPRISATPTLELRYLNLGAQGEGNRLRIRTDDGNNGNSCRSHLLIEDPNGDLFHNLDISSSDENARINLGNAASGTYHIWVGRVGSRCPTDLVIEKY